MVSHLFFRWEEEYTMRVELQQKVTDLQEVRASYICIIKYPGSIIIIILVHFTFSLL